MGSDAIGLRQPAAASARGSHDPTHIHAGTGIQQSTGQRRGYSYRVYLVGPTGTVTATYSEPDDFGWFAGYRP